MPHPMQGVESLGSEYRMAPYFEPPLSQSSGMLSVSTSPTSTTSSNESPRAATTVIFQLSYMPENSISPRDHEIIPKVEELDDDTVVDTKIESPTGSPTNRQDGDVEEHTPNGTTVSVRRPRGRPRKHPKTPPSNPSKAPKGRSKTGCLTCRRRKKKCDETKPACLHCQKNNVHCEGYPPKDYWQSGKQRATKDRRVSLSRPPKQLPAIVQGLENETDWFFFDHFNTNLSRVLCFFADKNNPFKELLLPMATNHPGLMHSLLCLAGTHLIATEPSPRFESRQTHHFERALKHLWDNMAKPTQVSRGEAAVIDDPTVAQIIVLCLKSIVAGETKGEYRPHLNAAKHLVNTQPSTHPEFRLFIFEFFHYHDLANSITSLDYESVLMTGDFNLPDLLQPESGMFLGVADGLREPLKNTRQLRDRVRARREQGMRPAVDYTLLKEAQAIDQSIRHWESRQPEGTPRRILAYLYRQCAWLYLHRTISASVPSPQIYAAVDEGLHFVRNLPTDSSSMSILLFPLYILGLSAFAEEQRPEILQAFENLQAFSNLGNIKHALSVVKRVWEMMDAGDEGSWDFEKVQKRMGMDFLVT